MTETVNRSWPPGSLIIVKRYTGTMIARIESSMGDSAYKARLLMQRGWTSTTRTVVAADIVGSAGVHANKRQRVRLAQLRRTA